MIGDCEFVQKDVYANWVRIYDVRRHFGVRL